MHQTFELCNNERIFLNSRGVNVRGLIAKKIGFPSYITDNQQRGPKYFQDQVNTCCAVPGNGFYKTFKKIRVDYFEAIGYITFIRQRLLTFNLGMIRTL